MMSHAKIFVLGARLGGCLVRWRRRQYELIEGYGRRCIPRRNESVVDPPCDLPWFDKLCVQSARHAVRQKKGLQC